MQIIKTTATVKTDYVPTGCRMVAGRVAMPLSEQIARASIDSDPWEPTTYTSVRAMCGEVAQ